MTEIIMTSTSLCQMYGLYHDSPFVGRQTSISYGRVVICSLFCFLPKYRSEKRRIQMGDHSRGPTDVYSPHNRDNEHCESIRQSPHATGVLIQAAFEAENLASRRAFLGDCLI